MVAILYIAVGALGFSYHFPELLALHPDAYAMEATELLAIVAGVFLLCRKNWARWLSIAWIAFHVAISIGHPRQELIIHCVLFVLITFALLRPAANLWFKGESA